MDFACSEVSKALTSISSELESRGGGGGSQSTARRQLQWLSIQDRLKSVVTAFISITCGRKTIPCLQ